MRGVLRRHAVYRRTLVHRAEWCSHAVDQRDVFRDIRYFQTQEEDSNERPGHGEGTTAGHEGSRSRTGRGSGGEARNKARNKVVCTCRGASHRETDSGESSGDSAGESSSEGSRQTSPNRFSKCC